MKTFRQTAIIAAVLLGAFAGRASAQVTDQFNYTVGPPVPSPWVWAVSGSSTNQITVSSGNKVLRTNYSGSGWYTLTRNDVASTTKDGTVYDIDFWDDGTQNYGILFSVQLTDGSIAGIGVNNNVANGKYYFRTNPNGNTGTIIQAPRNGMAFNNNWHLLQIYVVHYAANPSENRRVWAAVDGIPSTSVALGETVTASSVSIMGNWSKPASAAYFDNFRTKNFAASFESHPVASGNCSATLGSVSTGSDQNGTFLFNPSSTDWAYVDCSFPGQYLNGYSYFVPFGWFIMDNYDGTPNQIDVPDNWAIAPSTTTAGKTIFGGLAWSWQGGTLGFGFTGNLRWPVGDDFSYDVMLPFFNAGAMVHFDGWIPPVGRGGASRLYGLDYGLIP